MRKIGFIACKKPHFMVDGLYKWIDEKPNNDHKFAKSLFPHDRIALYSLKERIVELERMRDQILYELDRLKSLTEERHL